MADEYEARKVLLQVYEGRRIAASFEMNRVTEVGRRQSDEPPPYRLLNLQSHDRVIIADLPETQVSRRHLKIEVQPGDKIRLSNESSNSSVAMLGGVRLEPKESVLLDLPVACEIGGKVVRIMVAPTEALNLQSLQEATLAPGKSRSFGAAKKGGASIFGANQDQFSDSEMLEWLQASMEVFQSAATSLEFLSKAARAAVELVELDRAAVLLFQQGDWTTASLQTSEGELSTEGWQASRTMLRQVLEQRRTFFHVPTQDPGMAASLVNVQSLVAAPFLNAKGEVLGAIYGERRVGANQSKRPPIREIDAKLVELLAYGVASGISRMEQERLIVAQRIRFEQFFTPELARVLEVRGDEMLAAKDAEISVLFCDIKGFSRISANCGAALAIEWVCDVLSELSDCVAETQGVLVDYSGDALEALWGAPVETADHASLACQAAVKMRGRLANINARWHERLGEATDISLGIHTGTAKVGNIGSRRKFKYGALGTTVNLASRLQGATKYVGCPMVVSQATVERIGSELDFRRLCTIRTVNIQEPVGIYQLTENVDADWLKLKEGYEQALTAFEQQNFEKALAAIGGVLSRFTKDLPSQILQSRISEVNSSESFDSIWTLEGK